MNCKRWALFLSGRGSTAQSVMDLAGHLDIGLVVSSKASAQGLQRARRMGLAQKVLPKEIDWQELHEDLCRRRISHIFLLGFMRLLPADFVQKWQGRIVNVHPSLLPAYPGSTSIQDSYTQRAPMGVTIHQVTAEMDAGPKLLQQKILVEPSEYQAGDVSQSIAKRVARTEQKLIRHWINRI